MRPIIKWPGGKTGEIRNIKHLIPDFDRYIEPFFGGGALFFHLAPNRAIINDVSTSLIQFYSLVKAQDPDLKLYLLAYDYSFTHLIDICGQKYEELETIFSRLYNEQATAEDTSEALRRYVATLYLKIAPDFDGDSLWNREAFEEQLFFAALDKLKRTVNNYRKQPFSNRDLRENLITGFAGGYYMYFRQVFNDIKLKRIVSPSQAYEAANFYFIREYCYGSMFRYNKGGEFNIPYGGMSYTKKNFKAKIENIFNVNTARLFSNTDISCMDFEHFLKSAAPTGRDFIFLDPPYDTDFSDYEGRDFTRNDQRRLADVLARTPAKFILIIKNTEYIRSLYEPHFPILAFDKSYTYNVKSRNDRAAEHLIIMNFAPDGRMYDSLELINC